MKIKSLDYIRGLAAFLVVVYHYFIFFFTNQKFSAGLCGFEPLEFTDPLIGYIKEFPFDLGQFAVGLFFFLSGFLTPSLVERYKSRGAFIKNRFFRLWPIYIVGLLINILFVWGGSLYLGAEFPYTLDHIMASFCCLRDLLGYSYITGIVWTFEIEVKFAVFCILVYSLIEKRKLLSLIGVQALFFLVVATLYLPYKEDLVFSDLTLSVLKALMLNSKYFCLLLIGMFLSFFKNKNISKEKLITVALTAFFLFEAQEYLTVSLSKFIHHSVSYVFAFFAFSLITLRKTNEHEQLSGGLISSALIYISKISYPLYLIHAVPGYIIMYVLYDSGFSLGFGIVVGLAGSFWGASLLHKYIELPMHRIGRGLKESYSPKVMTAS